MKKDVLMEFERTIRNAKGSKTIAIPSEVLQVLKSKEGEKIKILVLKNGDVKLESMEE